MFISNSKHARRCSIHSNTALVATYHTIKLTVLYVANTEKLSHVAALGVSRQLVNVDEQRHVSQMNATRQYMAALKTRARHTRVQIVMNWIIAIHVGGIFVTCTFFSRCGMVSFVGIAYIW